MASPCSQFFQRRCQASNLLSAPPRELCECSPLRPGGDSQGGTPFFVQDLNTVSRAKLKGSKPQFWTELSGKVLFSADIPNEGRELFVTQRSSPSTQVLKILRPGVASAHPVFLGKLGKLAFFSADDGINGLELWVSDGTGKGTLRILNYTPSSKQEHVSKSAALTI
jgi:ELWxxDGT repeat protein